MNKDNIIQLISSPIVEDIRIGVMLLSRKLEIGDEKSKATKLLTSIFDDIQKDLTHADFNAPQKRNALEKLKVFCDANFASSQLILDAKKLIYRTSILPATVDLWDQYEELK